MYMRESETVLRYMLTPSTQALGSNHPFASCLPHDYRGLMESLHQQAVLAGGRSSSCSYIADHPLQNLEKKPYILLKHTSCWQPTPSFSCTCNAVAGFLRVWFVPDSQKIPPTALQLDHTDSRDCKVSPANHIPSMLCSPLFLCVHHTSPAAPAP